MNLIRLLSLLFIVVGHANCDVPDAVATLELQEIQRYGEEEAQAGAVAGGGMLASVHGIVELPRDLAVSPGGHLGVLDHVRQQVVWYDRDSSGIRWTERRAESNSSNRF